MNFEKWQHYYRARFFHFWGNEQVALEEYRNTLTVAPDFVRAAEAIAFIYAKREDFVTAAIEFGHVLKIDPDNAEMHFNQGYAYDKHGDLPQAIAAFENATRLKPQLDRAWYGMGICYAKQGNHEAAAKALHEAATLQPMNPHAWYALGMAHFHLNQPDKVTDIIKHLHRFDPIMTRHLIQETGRSDLSHLVADLVV